MEEKYLEDVMSVKKSHYGALEELHMFQV